MSRSFLLSAVLLLTGSLFAPVSQAQMLCGEGNEETCISLNIDNDVRLMVKKDNFAGLDAMAEGFRTSKARTPSGTWKLALFYKAMFQEYFQLEDRPPSRWAERQAWAERWVASSPRSPTAHIVLAREMYYRGTRFRGYDTSDKVPAKRREMFLQYMELAAGHLEKHKALASQDPYYYSTLENIALFSGWNQGRFRHIFDEGTARHPDYEPIYYVAMTRSYSKWGGSLEMMRSTASHAMTRVPQAKRAALYARMYDSVQNEWGEDIFETGAVDWSLMSRGIDDIIKQYPTQWNIQRFTALACRANDRSKTRALLARNQPPVQWTIWHPPVREQCVDFAAGKAATGA